MDAMTDITPDPLPASDCCGGVLEVAGRTTHYYLCGTCGKPCDGVTGG